MTCSRSPRLCAFAAIVLPLLAIIASAQSSFVNWETPHVSPLALSPDGTHLFAVNTADNRLEIFDVTAGLPVPVGVVPVGLDPVSVRARSNAEVWVVNHVSDNISRVNVTTLNVIATLTPGDEPTDVVFANNRAFVTLSQLNQVAVYDLANLAAAPTIVTIEGEDPRALAVSPDGTKVYAAIFESGNDTTILDRLVVSNGSGPYGGQNPPPNDGTLFNPPQRAGNPAPPPEGLIVKKDPATGQWKDDNDRDWSAFVTWGLHGHDIAVIDTASLAVTYINRLMNLNMHMTVRPDGHIVVVGTDATNHVRFEPNIQGQFVRTTVAVVDPANPTTPLILDLNPHLADEYATGVRTLPPAERTDSLADPRGVAWRSDGVSGYVAGMGSNNVAVISVSAARLATILVGQGPTGLALDESRGRLYVLNKFDATLSVIETTGNTELAVVPFHDPTPPVIRDGRPFLYDAPRTSGLGVTACGSCHIDGRLDPLAWDLGDPSGTVKTFNQTCAIGPLPVGGCENWHPMKGPMRTQTLQGIVGTEPLHWRGDREGLSAFNPAFQGLLGNDVQLAQGEMDAFEDFIATIKFPPNPNRTITNGFQATLAGGNPATGSNVFQTIRIDGGAVTCNECHTTPTGTNGGITPALALQTSQSIKVPQLRNMHEKTGFLKTSQNNNLGFGFVHEGTIDTLFAFLQFNGFNFQGDQQRRDVVAFLLSFSTDTHAGVGVQVTIDGTNNAAPAVVSLVNQMITLANGNAVGLVVRGRQGGVARGYRYMGANVFQSDVAGETIGATALRLAAAAGNELTWTLVPVGTQTRIGIDRDEDTFFDRDEIVGCGDPANAAIGPGHFTTCDSDCDGTVDFFDIDPFLLAVFDPLAYQIDHANCHLRCNNDANNDGAVDFFDIDSFLECLFGP